MDWEEVKDEVLSSVYGDVAITAVSIPLSGYKRGVFAALPGLIYFIRCKDGEGFAVIRLLEVDEDEGRYTFEWIYETRHETLNKVSWKTGVVSLEADNFYLIADRQTFYGDVETTEIHSDPGDADSCTLEIEWQENGVEMRLYLYFESDGVDWWSDEFRTYNGREDGDWIYYTGEFFKSRLGTAFMGDFERESNPNNDYSGKVHFDNLKLQAFLTQKGK
jgi:hypothetical protein